MKKQPVKIYGIFKRTEKGLLGYVENSFSMSWEHGVVRIWRGNDGVRVFQNDFINDKKHNKDGAFLVRLNSKKSPVELFDWHPNRKETRKFEYRNAKFRAK